MQRREVLEVLEVLDGLEQRRYPAPVANRGLDKRVDLPEVKVAFVLGVSGSTRQAKQPLGRILRTTGTAQAFLYEIVTHDTNELTKSRSRCRSNNCQRTGCRRLDSQRGPSAESPTAE